MSKNEKKPLGPNSVDMGERGTYDKRNKLNDLTGKEWVYFTNSVWITGYSPTARENVGLKTRKIHPSPKPPALMKDIILIYMELSYYLKEFLIMPLRLSVWTLLIRMIIWKK